VVIENIERHVGLKEPLVPAIVNGAGEVSIPTVLSTMCICIVFVPIFLLQGVAKYLFSPLSLSVCVSLIASLLLSFTLVPLLFRILMQSTVEQHGNREPDRQASPARRAFNPFRAIHSGFERGFGGFREAYRNGLAFSVTRSAVTVMFFGVLMVCSLVLFPLLGQDFFPQVDAGQMRLHVRAPPATRIEETQRQFADVERAIRKIVGNDQIDTMLNNIGLPYSGINIALSDSATVGPMDGEILVSLKKKHTPTAGMSPTCGANCQSNFPRCSSSSRQQTSSTRY
jgi:multidrug efflux pump subunit AcrB